MILDESLFTEMSEQDILEEAKKKKKRKKSKNKLSLKGFGWWPIYLDDDENENHNCGNMEYNNDMFNKMMGNADYSNDVGGDIGASDAGAGEGAGAGMGESLEVNNYNEIEISYALKKFINEHKHLIQDEDWDELFEKAEWSLSSEEQVDLVEMLRSIGCDFEVLD